MPTVMKLINNLNNISNCFQNGYELRGSMGNRQTSNNIVSMNGNANEGHLTRSRSTTRNRLKEPLTVECNGFSNTVSVRSDGVLVEKDTPGRLCRSKSKSCPGNGSQLGPLSPTDGIRPRRNVWKLPSCLLGTTAEDSRSTLTGRTNSITMRSKSDSECKSDLNKTEISKSNSVSCKVIPSVVKHDCKLKIESVIKQEENKLGDSPDDKKNTAKGDKKLLEDNKEYYKVEVLSSKLRSTRQVVKEYEMRRQREELDEPLNKKTELIEQNGDSSNLSYDDQDIHARKTRQSQAEDEKSINLPRKKLKLRHSIELTNPNFSSEMTPSKKSKNSRFSMVERLNMEADKFMFGDPRKELEEQAEDSSPEIVTPKRKRKSHAELFLIDNLDYYKFELPATRLRNGIENRVVKQESTDPEECKGIIRIDFDEIKYSFELGIQQEMWYHVFLRSRSRTRQSLWQNKVPQQSRLLLPFEKKYKSSEPIKSKAAIPPPPLAPPAESESVLLKKRKRRLSSIAEEDKPRKSPRCHASTQAIMSSQLPRKNLYCSSLVNSDQDCDPENRFHDSELFPECCEFSRTNPYSHDVQRLVDKLGKQLHLEIAQLNLCEILRDYSRSYHQMCSESNGSHQGAENSSDYGGSSNQSIDGTSSNKKLRHKKRRINMTGWPCRPKRKAACKINYNEKMSSISTPPATMYSVLRSQRSIDESTCSSTTSSHLSSIVEQTLPTISQKKVKKRKVKASNRYKY